LTHLREFDIAVLTVTALLSLLSLGLGCIAPPPPAPTQAPTTAAPVVGNCRCGQKGGVGTKIVGGQAASRNEYPWQVGLVSTRGGRPFCGGILISSDTVLTAAHCQTSVNSFNVVVGDHDATVADGEERISPSQWISHPNYRGNDNDFAIIKLSRPVTFSTKVLPACLPDPGKNYDNVQATVTGWGTIRSGGSQPNILQEVDVNTMTNGQCHNTLYSASDISNNMMCASGPGKDSCQGDSGGPLVTRDGNAYSLIGVVSWGYGCAQSNAPGVYARVTSQLGWINGHVSGTTCPKP